VPYQVLADAVLVLHFGVVLFVVGGLLLVVAGNWLQWRWVNRLWFRCAHLLAILVVAIQAWLGELCPLTKLESWLRVQAGTLPYDRSFVEYWLQRIIFYEAPFWVFTASYTAFAALVALVWWRYPPRWHSSKSSDA
jgi:Protein of Unknown function (DUF2784)